MAPWVSFLAGILQTLKQYKTKRPLGRKSMDPHVAGNEISSSAQLPSWMAKTKAAIIPCYHREMTSVQTERKIFTAGKKL